LGGAHHAHAAGALCLHGKCEHLSGHLKVGSQVGVAVALPAGQQEAEERGRKKWQVRDIWGASPGLGWDAA
jgi:hypothetical protein